MVPTPDLPLLGQSLDARRRRQVGVRGDAQVPRGSNGRRSHHDLEPTVRLFLQRVCNAY